MHCPIVFTLNSCTKVDGRIIINNCKGFGSIRVGFHEVLIKQPAETGIFVKGTLQFEGAASIGRGSRIRVADGGCLVMGDNFAISASTEICCYKKILIGEDVQFSWDCLVMDGDSHKIFDENGTRINQEKEIRIGDKVWIGCRTTILKGANIPSNTVIGACSFVTNGKMSPNTIIVGSPAKSIKNIGGWHL